MYIFIRCLNILHVIFFDGLDLDFQADKIVIEALVSPSCRSGTGASIKGDFFLACSSCAAADSTLRTSSFATIGSIELEQMLFFLFQ